MAVGCAPCALRSQVCWPATVRTAHPTIRTQKHFTPEDTAFYFVNCACGLVNNMKLFSVSSVTLWWIVFEFVSAVSVQIWPRFVIRQIGSRLLQIKMFLFMFLHICPYPDCSSVDLTIKHTHERPEIAIQISFTPEWHSLHSMDAVGRITLM